MKKNKFRFAVGSACSNMTDSHDTEEFTSENWVVTQQGYKPLAQHNFHRSYLCILVCILQYDNTVLA